MDARSDLINHQSFGALVRDDEHFDREHADIIQRVDNLPGKPPRLQFRGARYGGRDARSRQDMALVFVFTDIKGGELAGKAARDDRRNLALETDVTFKNFGLVAKGAVKG